MTDKSACIIGASGGIGSALAALLPARGYGRIHAGMRSPRTVAGSEFRPFAIDLCDTASIETAAADIAAAGPLDLLVVATGVLHREPDIRPERSLKQIERDAMETVFSINTIGPALVARYFLPLLARDRRAVAVFLSARVGSIADNRLGGWHSYRASKAALNALVRGFAIEARARNGQSVVAALHPGTVDTGLSKPFQRGVPAGQLFTASQSARHLLDVADRLGPDDGGGFFAWDGSVIPF